MIVLPNPRSPLWRRLAAALGFKLSPRWFMLSYRWRYVGDEGRPWVAVQRTVREDRLADAWEGREEVARGAVDLHDVALYRTGIQFQWEASAIEGAVPMSALEDAP